MICSLYTFFTLLVLYSPTHVPSPSDVDNTNLGYITDLLYGFIKDTSPYFSIDSQVYPQYPYDEIVANVRHSVAHMKPQQFNFHLTSRCRRFTRYDPYSPSGHLRPIWCNSSLWSFMSQKNSTKIR